MFSVWSKIFPKPLFAAGRAKSLLNPSTARCHLPRMPQGRGILEQSLCLPGHQRGLSAACVQPALRDGGAVFGFFNAWNHRGQASTVAKALLSRRQVASVVMNHGVFKRHASQGNSDGLHDATPPQGPANIERRDMTLRYEFESITSSPVIDLEMCGRRLPFVVDTGCIRTVMGLHHIAQLGLTDRIIPASRYGVVGVFPFNANFEGVSVQILADVLNVPWNLLGVDILQPLGCQIDLDPVAPKMVIQNDHNVRQNMVPTLNLHVCKIAGKKITVLADTGTTGFLLCPTIIATKLPVHFQRCDNSQLLLTLVGDVQANYQAQDVLVSGFGREARGLVTVVNSFPMSVVGMEFLQGCHVAYGPDGGMKLSFPKRDSLVTEIK